MKIGISGASGQLGKAVIAELKARGDDNSVIGISRTPETVQPPMERRYGDYDEPDTLVEAYQDLDRLLIIPGPDVSTGVRGRQFLAAINAALRVGVGHIVLLSSSATREVAEPEMYAPYWTGEQHLIKMAPRWTILRMNYYAESFAQIASILLPTGVLPGLDENRVAFVSREDVAAVAARILLGKGHSGAIYNATGPVAVTGEERAALISEITQRPFRFAVLDEAHLRRALVQAGIPREYIDSVVDIQRRFAAGNFDIVTGDVERLAGRPARTLREVLSQELIWKMMDKRQSK
jgi:NAD(P)H dehydrogenase (quinone)